MQGGVNATQRGDPHSDTADFNDRFAGNLRVDYLLPSKGLRVCGGGVFWPTQSDPSATLVWGDEPAPSSDHRLVWLDVSVAGARCPPGSDPTASASFASWSLKITRTKDFFSTRFREIPPQQDVVDVFAVFAARGARDEFLARR